MKSFFFALFFIQLLSILTTSGQEYYFKHGFTNGGTVTTCDGKFFDSQLLNNYTPHENYAVTFCPASPNKIIQVVFTNISISAGDTLFVFDGKSVQSPVIDTFTNSIQNLRYYTPSLSNTSGCLTFKFVSDGKSESEGWEGEIKCIYPCKQKIVGKIHANPVEDVNGYSNICFGDFATLSLFTNYPDNNVIYQQNDRTSTFHWVFGDGKDTTGKNLLSVKHVYTTPGGYYARVMITDSNGCGNSQPIRIPIRTSLQPIFNINPPAYICLLDTAFISPGTSSNRQGSIITPPGSFVTLPVSGDSVALPDSPPACFTSSIVIEQFAPNQTLQNINDLEGIYMNMEHSYLGDLTISIEAPNGAKVFLKTTVEGSPNDGTFLGEPVDESLWGAPSDPAMVGIRGKGYTYSFNNTPQFGTMWNEASKYNYSYTDNGGQVITNHYYLPAGSYKSEESLLGLLGTPLNGKWTLTICDQQAIDNGYLFNWKVQFKKSILPNAETYTVPVASQTWLVSGGLVSNNNSTAIISPSSTGSFPYTFRVKDDFGCFFDTTIKIKVNAIPAKPVLGADTTICTGRSLTLRVSNFDATNTYKWSTNQKGVATINISQPGNYAIEAENMKGCKNSDTINVSHINPFTINLGNDTSFCASKPNNLTPTSSTDIVSWKWSTGTSETTYSTSSAGIYWVEAKDTLGCLVRDTIIVTDNPINHFELPNDTTICAGSGYTLTLHPVAGTRLLWNDNTTTYTRFIDKAAAYMLSADYNGCIHKTAFTVGLKPIPGFNLGRDTSLCNGYNLLLKASFPGATYRWNNGSNDSVIIAIKTGEYWAEANLNGCSFRDTLIFQQKDCACDIKMPNAFSPNGDGINDFYIPSIKCFPKDYHFSIFNRLGQMVFESRSYSTIWDGKFNGTNLPVATYYYILSFFNTDQMETEKAAGSITLLR